MNRMRNEELREVGIKIVGDKEYRLSRKEWKRESQQLVEEVSKLYQKEFGICFVTTEFIEWDFPNLPPISGEVYDLFGTEWILRKAAKAIPSKGDIVIVLTGKNLERRGHGRTFNTRRRIFKEHYVIIWADSINPRNALIHEIGHLYGAEHPLLWGWRYNEKYSSCSVMDPESFIEYSQFDPINKEVILRNRDKFKIKRRKPKN